MSDSITRCPKCGTSFRVGVAHLNSAKGAVRCGSCLNIFNAKQNLVVEESSSAKLASSKNADTDTKANQNSAKENNDDQFMDDFFDDDMLISDDMDKKPSKDEENEDIFGVTDDLQVQDTQQTKAISGASTSNLFERDYSKNDDDDDDPDDDESWALNLLKNLDEEEEDEAKAFKPWTTGQHEAQQTGSAKSKNKDQDDFQQDFADSDFDFDEDDNYADYSDYSSDYEIEDSVHDDTFQLIDEAGIEPEKESRAEPHFDRSSAFENIDMEITEDAYPATGRFYDSSMQSSYVDSIEPEPVEFAYKKGYSFWTSGWLFKLGAFVALIALLGQIAWLQLPTWSRIEPYRQYYTMACDLIGCTLPALTDRSKIRAANLVVRSHPTIAEALIVDAVLQNSAAFPQSFPDLDLIFTNAKDKPVAKRRLSPREYLGGELAGSENMPTGNPVHIAVEIADPGPTAVSYRISIAN